MIGSIGSSSVSTSLDKNAVALPKKAEKAEKADKSVADHVAELDEQEPIRSAHATLGTMIDTYL
jgi:hypothetical protein